MRRLIQVDPQIVSWRKKRNRARKIELKKLWIINKLMLHFNGDEQAVWNWLDNTIVPPNQLTASEYLRRGSYRTVVRELEKLLGQKLKRWL